MKPYQQRLREYLNIQRNRLAGMTLGELQGEINDLGYREDATSKPEARLVLLEILQLDFERAEVSQQILDAANPRYTPTAPGIPVLRVGG